MGIFRNPNRHKDYLKRKSHVRQEKHDMSRELLGDQFGHEMDKADKGHGHAKELATHQGDVDTKRDMHQHYLGHADREMDRDFRERQHQDIHSLARDQLGHGSGMDMLNYFMEAAKAAQGESKWHYDPVTGERVEQSTPGINFGEDNRAIIQSGGWQNALNLPGTTPGSGGEATAMGQSSPGQVAGPPPSAGQQVQGPNISSLIDNYTREMQRASAPPYPGASGPLPKAWQAISQFLLGGSPADEAFQKSPAMLKRDQVGKAIEAARAEQMSQTPTQRLSQRQIGDSKAVARNFQEEIAEAEGREDTLLPPEDSGKKQALRQKGDAIREGRTPGGNRAWTNVNTPAWHPSTLKRKKDKELGR